MTPARSYPPAELVEAGPFDSGVPSRQRRGQNLPPTVAKRIMDRMLQHRHYLLMTENAAIRDLMEPLENARNELLETIRKTAERDDALGDLAKMMQERRKLLRKRIDEVTQIAEAEVQGTARQSLRKVARRESEIVATILRDEIIEQIALDLVGPNMDRVEQMIDSPLGGKKFADRLKDTFGQMRRGIKSNLATSIAKGEGMDKAARRITHTFDDIGKQRATILARSEIQRVANESSMRLYERNSDVIKGVQWVATLDGRTCLICGGLDGETWTLNNPPQEHPPVHPQCRCMMSPITKTFEEMGIEAPETGGVQMRASQDGPVPVKNYRDWFAEQPAAFQRDVLGPSRFKLYRAGEIDFESMVKSNRIVRVGDLPEPPPGAGAVSSAETADDLGAGPVDFRAPDADHMDRLADINREDWAYKFDEVARSMKDHPQLPRLVDEEIPDFQRGKVPRAVKDRLDLEEYDGLGKMDSPLSRFREGDLGFEEASRRMADEFDDHAATVFREESARRAHLKLVNTWGATSADHDPWAVAIQRAARKEFNLDDAAWAHISRRMDDEIRTMADEALENYGDFIRTDLRRQYEATQEVFEEAGLDRVTLYRGSRFDDLPEGISTPPLAEIDDAPIADLASITQHEFQPLSSVAWDPGQAKRFMRGAADAKGETGVMFAADVPREKILAMPNTGFGIRGETEAVVLGGRYSLLGSTDESFAALQDRLGEFASAGERRAFEELFDNLGEIKGIRALDDVDDVGPFSVRASDEFGQASREIREELAEFENTVYNSSTENGLFLDADGNTVVRADGTEDALNISDEAERQIKQEASVMTHNHPDVKAGEYLAGPSPPDLNLMDNHNLDELRAVVNTSEIKGLDADAIRYRVRWADDAPTDPLGNPKIGKGARPLWDDLDYVQDPPASLNSLYRKTGIDEHLTDDAMEVMEKADLSKGYGGLDDPEERALFRFVLNDYWSHRFMEFQDHALRFAREVN